MQYNHILVKARKLFDDADRAVSVQIRSQLNHEGWQLYFKWFNYCMGDSLNGPL
jgi:hypothetical protein